VSTLNVDKVDPSTGTDLEIGTSGDTITVPTGAGLTVVDEVKTNKISPSSGVAFTLGDSGDTFTVPSGVTIANSGTATGFGITQANFLPNANPLIINGNMSVAQRGTSSTGITGAGFYTVDRWDFDNSAGGGAASTWTQTQESLTSGDAFVDGFRNSIKVDVTTAAGTLAAGSNANIHQTIEAQNLQCLKFGGASAETFTVAFWVKATKTGTYILEGHISDPTPSRACSQAYTVSSSDTWEYKILNFPADTTGVIDNNNGSGMQLFWWIAAGTTFTSGTLSTTWTADTAANRAVGQVNASDSTSNNFEIAGVQMVIGTYTSSDLPPFQFESYAENLFRCQRYYRTWGGGHVFEQFSVGYNSATTTASTFLDTSVPVMRTTATQSVSSDGDWKIYSVASSYTATNVSYGDATARNRKLMTTTGGTMTVGDGCMLQANNTTSARFNLDAEL
jgi:hypothetical protein